MFQIRTLIKHCLKRSFHSRLIKELIQRWQNVFQYKSFVGDCQIILGQPIKLEYLITVQEGFSPEAFTYDSSYDRKENDILCLKKRILKKTTFGDRLNHLHVL